MHSKLTCTQYYLKQNSRSKDMRFLVKYHMQKKIKDSIHDRGRPKPNSLTLLVYVLYKDGTLPSLTYFKPDFIIVRTVQIQYPAQWRTFMSMYRYNDSKVAALKSSQVSVLRTRIISPSVLIISPTKFENNYVSFTAVKSSQVSVLHDILALLAPQC